MSFFIEDGQGSGHKMKVNTEGQGTVQAEIHELQHHISKTQGQVFQIIGRETAVAATTQTVLHIRNTSTSHLFAVSYIRLQVAGLTGGTALPDDTTYFQMGFNRTYVSGGSSVTPANMNKTSGNAGTTLVCYDESPVVAGTFEEFDTWYANTAMMTYNKHGSLILGLNDTAEIRLVSDHTSGVAFCRVTGFFLENN